MGAVAEIRVAEPDNLEIPVIHKIPNEAVKQRLRLWHAWDTAGWAVTRVSRESGRAGRR